MTHLPSQARAGEGGRSLLPVLALDLGGTQLRSAVVLPDGTITHRRSARTPRGDAAALVAACVALLRATLEGAAQDGSAAARDDAALEPVAVGISAPGPLDPQRGVLIDPPNLHPSLHGFALADAIGASLGLPAVLERDTQLAALAEGEFGAARGLADYVYLTVSTGVGGAVVSDGVLLRGPDGVAGELGHLVVDYNGPRCGCGARGHLEAIASGTGICAAARAARSAGEVSAASPLGRAFAQRGDAVEARDVADAEDAGDRVAAVIMARARDAFAAAAVSIVDIFNPSRVVVGGGVALAQGDRLLGPARERVRAEAFRTQAQRVDIVPADLGDDVGLVGALLLVRAADLKPRATAAGRMALRARPPAGRINDATINRERSRATAPS